MAQYDAGALYDEVKNGRLKLEDLSDSGLNALKSYVYTKNLKSFPSEPTYYTKATEDALASKSMNQSNSIKYTTPKQNQMLNYSSSQPQAAQATQNALAQMYKDYQKDLADSTIYTGKPPAQARIGNIQKPTPKEIENRLYQSKVNQAIQQAQQIANDPSIETNNLLGKFGERLTSNIRSVALPSGLYGMVKGKTLEYLPTDVEYQLAQQTADLGNPVANTLTDLLGQGIGFFSPIGAEKSAASVMNEVSKLATNIPYANNALGKLSGNIVGKSTNIASKAVAGLPAKLQPAALNAMKEAARQVPGGLYLGAVDMPIRRDINPIDNPKEYAESIGSNVALASGFGAGASLGGSAIRGASRAISNKVNSELAQIADQVMKKYKFDVGQKRYDQFGGAEQAAKSATGNINMQRYKNSILTEDQIQAVKRNNADFALKEIADQQTKYLERQSTLNKAFEDLPGWQKQQALELYLERTKNDPKMQDFTAEKIREQRMTDVESTLGRLSELDRAFESLPTEVQMALKDYQGQIKTRGESMDMRQRELNASLGDQAKRDQLLAIYEDLFQSIPSEAEIRTQQLKSESVPMSNFSAENIRNQRQQALNETLSPIAIAEQNRVQRQQELMDAFEQLPQYEQERVMRNYLEQSKGQPKMSDFTAEKVRNQRQQALNETFSSLMNKENKRQMYEDLFDVSDPSKKKQLNELDFAITELEDQIKTLDSERKNQIIAERDRLWNEYMNRTKSTIDPMMETIQNNGFIRVPSKDSFYFEEYKSLTPAAKRKYFRYSDTAMHVDELSDAMGISANDLFTRLKEGNSFGNLSVEDMWLSEFRRKFGYEPTKERLLEFVNDQFESGDKSFPTPIDEITGYRENRDALQSVVDQMKTDRNDLIQGEYQRKISIDQAARENKSATEQVVKGQEMSSGFLPFMNRTRSGFQMKDVRSADPTMENVLTATKTFQETLKENIISKIKAPYDFAKDIYNSYFQYRHLLNDMPAIQNTFRKAEGMAQDARDFAKKQLDGILGSLRDKPEFEIFKRVIMLKDFEQELLAGRKVAGDLTLNQVQDELKSLNKQVQMSNSLKTAIQNHDRLMQAIADDLVSMGKLDPKSVKTNYYPHRVLDYTKKLDQTYGTGSNEVKAPYRFYTKQRGGSKKLIESDYISVMNNLLYKVKMDNQIDDFVEGILLKNNKMNELPNQIAEPMLHKDGVSVEFNDGNTYTFWDFNNKTYLIDDRLYQNLKDFKGKTQSSPLLKAGQQFTSWWKRITLDFAGSTFHWTNFLGDMLALYRDDPTAVKNIPKAVELLLKSDSKLSRVEQNILNLAKKQRIFQSGITEGILGEMFPKRPVSTKFTPELTKFAYYMNPFNILENVSNIRESVPRLAKFLTDVERIQKGEMVQSKILDVQKLKNQGLKDIDIAGKVTREGFIDYGFLSKYAQAELRGLLFPFFTFYHQNLKNWSKYVAKNPVNASAKFGVPFSVMMLWNYSGDRKDIENQLPDYIRDVPHLITGLKNENGDPYVLTFNTPLNAAENVMAINQLPRRIADVINGYESFDEAMLDQVKSTLKAPLKTVVGLTNSLFKAPVEAFANQNFFTGGKIVPERLPDSEQLKGKMKYVASQLFTPIGTIQRFQDQELSPDATIASGILNQYLNVPKIFGKYADLSRNARNQVYENATEAVNAQKEQKFAIENTYLDYALGKISKEQFKQAAKESGLTQEQVRNIAESPRVNIAIIDEKLKNERDTNKRRLLDEEKSKWQKIMQAQRIEFLPKSVRKEVMEGR